MQNFDISSETRRTYHYDDGRSFTIEAPKTLYLKQDERGDSHRVQNEEGEVFYPTRGWIAISWVPKDTKNPVDF